METMINWMSQNFYLTAGLGGFICGAALLYLVVRRTIQRREES